jgi:hypothetical protein
MAAERKRLARRSSYAESLGLSRAMLAVDIGQLEVNRMAERGPGSSVGENPQDVVGAALWLVMAG